MIKQTQTQKLSQKILPQIIQRQNLLAVPTLALEQMIKSELEENPLLEEVNERETDDNQDDELKSEQELLADKIKTEEYNWDDYYSGEYEGYKTMEYDPDNFHYEDTWKETITMHDNLLNQLYHSTLDDKQIFIGEEIIGNLDSDGYLRESNLELLEELNIRKFGTEYADEKFSEEEIETVIKYVQQFEPSGIAARNLKECLLIQLEESAIDTGLKRSCIDIIENYFEELRLRNYEKIGKDLKLSRDKVVNAFEHILKLNPKPGYNEFEEDHNLIYPDIIVTKKDNEYVISLNEKILPSLKINKEYGQVISGKNAEVNDEAKEFLSNKMERAKWFIDALKSRRQTMLKVMNVILIRQFSFFENNGQGLKPMIEKDVAEDIDMDISTVSRTVRGKYVQTDFGVYELKYFFSNSLTTDEGEDISTKEIKHKMREIINSEDKKKPLTDDKLVTILNEMGFQIARRTVAKYREAMKIPKARLRRKLN